MIIIFDFGEEFVDLARARNSCIHTHTFGRPLDL